MSLREVLLIDDGNQGTPKMGKSLESNRIESQSRDVSIVVRSIWGILLIDGDGLSRIELKHRPPRILAEDTAERYWETMCDRPAAKRMLRFESRGTSFAVQTDLKIHLHPDRMFRSIDLTQRTAWRINARQRHRKKQNEPSDPCQRMETPIMIM